MTSLTTTAKIERAMTMHRAGFWESARQRLDEIASRASPSDAELALMHHAIGQFDETEGELESARIAYRDAKRLYEKVEDSERAALMQQSIDRVTPAIQGGDAQ